MPRLAPNKAAPSEYRISQHLLAELVEPPPSPYCTSANLWERLDKAVKNANLARAEARRSSSSSFAGLDQAFNPHGQEARLKARSFLASAARASVRLQAAVEELEGEAAAAKAAHDADFAGWLSDQRVNATKVEAMNNATERTFRHELQRAEVELAAQHEALSRLTADELHRMEVEHARRVRQLTLQFDTERAALLDEATLLRGKVERTQAEGASAATAARISHDELQGENARLQREVASLQGQLAEETAMREAEQQATKDLHEANSKLRAELASLGSELSHTRADLRGQVERLTREKRAISAELEAQVRHLHDLREAEVTHLEASLQHATLEGQRTASNLHEQLHAVHAERESDASAYIAKIERLQAVQRAALTVGSARGRQLLYTESLRAPELHRASSVSWRGNDWDAAAAAGVATAPHAHHTQVGTASVAGASITASLAGSPRGRSSPKGIETVHATGSTSPRPASSTPRRSKKAAFGSNEPRGGSWLS